MEDELMNPTSRKTSETWGTLLARLSRCALIQKPRQIASWYAVFQYLPWAFGWRSGLALRLRRSPRAAPAAEVFLLTQGLKPKTILRETLIAMLKALRHPNL